jgi:hypothetical protein
LARFVDLLEAAELKLVGYETKTRGRFRLAVKPESITFSGVHELPPETTPVVPVRFTPVVAVPVAAYQNEAWVAWAVALFHSTLALYDGQLSGADGALAHLDTAEAASSSLPIWTVSVVQVRRAFVLLRESRYREATFWLRRVDTAVRQGRAHPAAKSGAQLVRAKMRYDQARYAEAEQLLGMPSDSVITRHPYWLNMNALIAGRKFITAKESDAPALLVQTLSALAEALGYVFLSHGDSSLLDGLCYNFGNNLLRGIKRGVIPDTCADTVMQWLAANILVCRKLGIGEDSIFASLLLVDVSLDHGYSVKQWPHLLRCEMSVYGNIEGVLSKALAQARLTGNILEIVQCLRRQVRMSTSPTAARRPYLEAVELLGKQSRNDLLLELADEWRSKFGRSPPAIKNGRGKKNNTDTLGGRNE